MGAAGPAPEPGDGPTTRIGILGGTFDPIHDAHLALAETARRALGLSRVLLIPAAVPPLKRAPGVAPAAHRLEMVRRAAAGHPDLVACDVEIERQERTVGPSYTVDTLRALRARYPSEELWFLMGSDALADLEAWHRPEELFELACFAIVCRAEADEGRPGDGPTGVPAQTRGGARGARETPDPETLLPARFAAAFGRDAETGDLVHGASGRRIRTLPFPPHAISSREIRARIRRGESVRDSVPAAVADYIEANELYRETS